MPKPKIIAFYLPQYHPTPHNDEWWGKGFTEWTNAMRAKPLFKGHEQPHIPGELGFYDLRMPEAREAQAALAREYGVDGFCYYYYRFAKGKTELDLPIKEMLKSGEPTFPFMICWANQTWHKKFWRYDGTSENTVLAEQEYNGEKDYTDFFYELLPFFRDDRYIRIDNKPTFMIHKPKDFPDVERFIQIWQSLAKKEGIGGIHFIGYINASLIPTYPIYDNDIFAKLKFRITNIKLKPDIDTDKSIVLGKGFDAVALNRQYIAMLQRGIPARLFTQIERSVFHRPYIIPYKKVIKTLVGPEDAADDLYPIVIPNWDHTPRSKYGGEVWINSTPDLFKQYFSKVLSEIRTKKAEHQIVFIKAWNEWGEGNYLEPDIKWGRKYLEAIRQALSTNQ